MQQLRSGRDSPQPTNMNDNCLSESDIQWSGFPASSTSAISRTNSSTRAIACALNGQNLKTAKKHTSPPVHAVYVSAEDVAEKFIQYLQNLINVSSYEYDFLASAAWTDFLRQYPQYIGVVEGPEKLCGMYPSKLRIKDDKFVYPKLLASCNPTMTSGVTNTRDIDLSTTLSAGPSTITTKPSPATPEEAAYYFQQYLLAIPKNTNKKLFHFGFVWYDFIKRYPQYKGVVKGPEELCKMYPSKLRLVDSHYIYPVIEGSMPSSTNAPIVLNNVKVKISAAKECKPKAGVKSSNDWLKVAVDHWSLKILRHNLKSGCLLRSEDFWKKFPSYRKKLAKFPTGTSESESFTLLWDTLREDSRLVITENELGGSSAALLDMFSQQCGVEKSRIATAAHSLRSFLLTLPDRCIRISDIRKADIYARESQCRYLWDRPKALCACCPSFLRWVTMSNVDYVIPVQREQDPAVNHSNSDYALDSKHGVVDGLGKLCDAFSSQLKVVDNLSTYPLVGSPSVLKASDSKLTKSESIEAIIKISPIAHNGMNISVGYNSNNNNINILKDSRHIDGNLTSTMQVQSIPNPPIPVETLEEVAEEFRLYLLSRSSSGYADKFNVPLAWNNFIQQYPQYQGLVIGAGEICQRFPSKLRVVDSHYIYPVIGGSEHSSDRNHIVINNVKVKTSAAKKCKPKAGGRSSSDWLTEAVDHWSLKILRHNLKSGCPLRSEDFWKMFPSYREKLVKFPTGMSESESFTLLWDTLREDSRLVITENEVGGSSAALLDLLSHRGHTNTSKVLAAARILRSFLLTRPDRCIRTSDIRKADIYAREPHCRYLWDRPKALCACCPSFLRWVTMSNVDYVIPVQREQDPAVNHSNSDYALDSKHGVVDGLGKLCDAFSSQLKVVDNLSTYPLVGSPSVLKASDSKLTKSESIEASIKISPIAHNCMNRSVGNHTNNNNIATLKDTRHTDVNVAANMQGQSIPNPPMKGPEELCQRFSSKLTYIDSKCVCPITVPLHVRSEHATDTNFNIVNKYDENRSILFSGSRGSNYSNMTNNNNIANANSSYGYDNHNYGNQPYGYQYHSHKNPLNNSHINEGNMDVIPQSAQEEVAELYMQYLHSNSNNNSTQQFYSSVAWGRFIQRYPM